MTHDELLARLDGQIESSKVIGCKCPACDNAVALRAVVELHKPIEPTVPVETHDDYWYGLCDDCLKTYPCPTLEAIEKELK